MVNVQEWLDENYPPEGTCLRKNETPWTNNFGKTRSEITKLDISWKKLEGFLDLTDFSNLKEFYCHDNQLTNLDLSKNMELRNLLCSNNQLTSVEFLNTLPHPEKLENLEIFDNNIQPTDIACFSKFTSLKLLKIGTMNISLAASKRNKFCGSLQAYQNLTKLRSICIEATAVDSGLEYLPASLATAIQQEKKESDKYFKIECSPHNLPDAGCKAIQDQLRPFDYDLGSWQLANFDLMLRVNPSNLWILDPTLFTEKEKKEKLIAALIAKIEETRQELGLKEFKNTKKIARLESKLTLLQKTVTELEEENANLGEELQIDREEFEKALEKSQEWRERQLKEMTDRKDKEISELKNGLETEKNTQDKLTSQLQEKRQLAEQQDKEMTNLNEDLTQLENELVTTKTQLVAAQNLTNNLDKVEKNLNWTKVIMVGGFFILIGLLILFSVGILRGNKKSKKKYLVK